MTPAQRHLTRLCARVCKLYELSPSNLLAEQRGGLAVNEARRLVYLVAHVGLGLSTTQIGEACGVSYQGVRKHITKAVALHKANRVFRATYQGVLKQTLREFERAGLELTLAEDFFR